MTITTGVYYIRNAGTGTVLDLAGGSSVAGTGIQGWEKHPLGNVWAPAQLWVVYKESADTYTIQNTNGRTYLDLRKKDNGTPIQGYPPSGTNEQKWEIIQAPGQSYYVIKNKATETFVDLYNGGSANATPVQGWAGSGPTTPNKHQLWYFDAA